MGLLIGIELPEEGYSIVREALENYLVINCTAGNVIRIMPSLTIDMKALEEGMNILEKIILKRGEVYENTSAK